MSKRHILIVSADEEIRKTLCPALTRHGFEIFEAQDGTEGLDLASRHAPDLVVLDTDMPGAGWVAFYEKICDRQGVPLFPAFVLTTDEHFPDEYAVEGFMRKPLCPDTLVERLHIIIDRDKAV